jgi:choline dehydrogenase-like flavoprotein
MPSSDTFYDAVIVGAGVSGSFIAHALTAGGMKCVLLEAGRYFTPETYPQNEVDANSLLYWGGGIELNSDATIGLLRPRAVGGGSIVNQALVDRFDDDAFDSWRSVSGVPFFSRSEMDRWYDKAAEQIEIRTVPEEYRNRNGEIFRSGFENNGYRCAPLERAQGDCRFADGNCCIECLRGCPIGSKQSMVATVLPRARDAGLHIVPEFEAMRVEERDDGTTVRGRMGDGSEAAFRGRILVLGAGAIGNSRLLLLSGLQRRLPAIGSDFYTHPQYLSLGLYDEPVNAQRGPLQSYKSADANFRRSGFKLENVFTGPVGLSILVPSFGASHLRRMKKLTHMGCIEVAVRDTNPGRIKLSANGRPAVEKTLNAEDRRRRERGREAIRNIFHSTGAKEIIDGEIAVGLHLMGGCGMGIDAARSVVSPEFRLHGFRRVYAADSSVFPNAPGINPSFTIMAIACRAADQILRDSP